MSTTPLNFQKAVYEGEPAGPDQCAYCGRGITTAYYRVGGLMACPPCAEQAQTLVPPNSHKVFLHAVSLGAAAALLGCILYAMVVIVTGWTIGYAAIGVGYLIGWAMRKTAGQHGGRRYQWAAAILTYAAVAVAFVPIAIHASSKVKSEQAQVQQQAGTPEGPRAEGAAQKADNGTVQFGGFAVAVAELLGLGLISPFLELTGNFGSGALNLFIIFIGVRFAWQMMAVRTVEVEGPFEGTSHASH